MSKFINEILDELREMFEYSFGRKLTDDEETMLIFTFSRATVYWILEKPKEERLKERGQQ
jgi:DNA invertase Pin-like site-specific DNA recombinase